MAFSPTNRVAVTDQTSGYRNQFGTVMTVDNVNHFNNVRLDGMAADQTTPLRDDQLKSTTKVCPIDYDGG